MAVIGRQGFARNRAEAATASGTPWTGPSHRTPSTDPTPQLWGLPSHPHHGPREPCWASRPETQSGVSLGRPCPSPPVPREEEAALKRTRLSARLSGSSICLGFHPPKQATGRRGLPRPAAGSFGAAGPSPLASPAYATGCPRGGQGTCSPRCVAKEPRPSWKGGGGTCWGRGDSRVAWPRGLRVLLWCFLPCDLEVTEPQVCFLI